MKGKVIHAQTMTSKKGNQFQKLLVQFGDSVVGYIMSFGDKVYTAGDTVEFAVGTDFYNNLRLEVK